MGSHIVGGFQESFNTARFCRYCELDMNDADLSSRGVPRSIDGYKQCVQTSEKGIKFDSVFNELEYYHVAQPGLPPCLGHDLFEGIVAYDMVLIIKYLIRMKWFSYEQLNYQIENFRYRGGDALDKPSPISAKSEKLSGHAIGYFSDSSLF